MNFEHYLWPGTLARGGELVAKPGASRIIRWMYCLLVFSIPFESLNLGLAWQKTLGSTPKVLGVILIVLTVCIRGLHIRRPPTAFVCFASYLAFLTVSGLLRDQDYFSKALSALYTLSQLIIFFYISYDILNSRTMIGVTVAATALSCTLLVALQLSGAELSGMGSQNETRGPPRAGVVERESALGNNPNNFGGMMCIGFICLLWLLCKAGEADRRVAMACMAVVGGVIAAVIVRTGSRGATLALVASILTFVFIRINILTVIKRLVASLVLLAVMALLLPDDVIWSVADRWDRSLASGDLARREYIYPAAWDMFLERPLFGWGPFSNRAELGARMHTGGVSEPNEPTDELCDTHNLPLMIVTEAGIVGAAPFIAGFYLCYSAAWCARKGPYGFIALAVMNATFIWNLSSTYYDTKIFWLSLALALACGDRGVTRDDRSPSVTRRPLRSETEDRP